MSDTMPTSLRDAVFLSAILNTCIPPGGGSKPMPGAGGIGIESAVAETIAADSQAGPEVVTALDALRERAPRFASLASAEQAALIEAQVALNPAPVRALLRHIYLAYYQHPTVLEALGEPPRPPFPEGFDLEPTDPELLLALAKRRTDQPIQVR